MNQDSIKAPGRGEFVTMLALMTSLVAFSTDAVLPILPQIRHDLQLADSNAQQLVVSALFLGLGFAQIFYGPLSDSIGRKRTIYLGYGIFVLGSILSLVATTIELMLLGRVLQGMGAAGPRIVCLALVRDQYAGSDMARIMSIIMAVFIIVPTIAPALGQAIAMVTHWRGIFGAFLVLAVSSGVWFSLRHPETLPPERRRPFTASSILSGIKAVLNTRAAIGYACMGGIVFGAFLAYLSTAQQLFNTVYGITELFPLYFGFLALAFGLATWLNSRVVGRFGMHRMCALSLGILTTASVLFFLVAAYRNGVPALWSTMAYFSLAFMCVGILMGNTASMAIEPLGHIAGIAASVIGSITTLLSVLLGWFIGQMFDGTVLPLVGGFAGLGLLAAAVMWWTGRARVPAG